ncbi:hypothetical protein [Vibrio owensii]|uniref:hypothetical protein n=1 Tax=Vibrio owensii TaxID=696485 RepID=UPI003CC55F36
MIDIEAKAKHIQNKLHLIFEEKLRLGLSDDQSRLHNFKAGYIQRSCKLCNEILSPEDAFWYADNCECCERETFIQKELNKLSPDHARSVKAVLMFNLSSLSKPTVH